MVVAEIAISRFNNVPAWTFTVAPRYYAQRYYADSDITVGRGPRISAARGKCQMGLLKPT